MPYEVRARPYSETSAACAAAVALDVELQRKCRAWQQPGGSAAQRLSATPADDAAAPQLCRAAAHADAVSKKWQMVAKQRVLSEWEAQQEALRKDKLQARREATNALRAHDRKAQQSADERALAAALKAQRTRRVGRR